jgi:sugar porter (SP) family MFS transporter
MSSPSKFSSFSLFVSIIAALGGLLFGYNTSVVSGALLFIAQDFHLSTFQQELVVSTLLIGALLGAICGGFLADSFGRKKTLFMTLLLFLVGIVLLMEAEGFSSLLTGRFIVGLGIGVASLAVPLYIAEMSPPGNRGALVSLNQLAITIGILLAYIVSYHYSESGEWRDMFGFALIPVAIQFVGLFFIPETPSWLMNHNRRGAAEKVLLKAQLVHESSDTEKEVHSNKSWKELFSPHVRRAFLIGIGISVFQQITGINTVIYYAPQIFQKAGYQTAQGAILATMLVGIVNVGMTIVALWLIDRLGRRPLLVGGLIGMGLSLAVLGFSFFSGGSHVGLVAILGVMAYVACFAISLGPVAWLIISEIYPLGIRGRAMGVATFANWVCNYIVSLTFLSLIDTFGTGMTFWLYTLICVLALWFVLKMVPETRGKTLEQIQHFWKRYE